MATRRRDDGRRADELRPVKLTPGFVGTADGSCLIELGGTRVICTACFAPGVPAWRAGSGAGWVTAEYGMLPASTSTRKGRPTARPDGRGVEIQRLIGRTMRHGVRFDRLGENTFFLDCDVLEADGGTRTASITGAQVALAIAARRCAEQGRCGRGVCGEQVAAVSVGMLDGRAVLDLAYREDARADVDLNVAMAAGGRIIELQGTAEGAAFDREQLDEMLSLAAKGIRRLRRLQTRAIREGCEQ